MIRSQVVITAAAGACVRLCECSARNETDGEFAVHSKATVCSVDSDVEEAHLD